MDKQARWVESRRAAESVRDDFRELVAILDKELANGASRACEANLQFRRARARSRQALDLVEKLLSALASDT